MEFTNYDRINILMALEKNAPGAFRAAVNSMRSERNNGLNAVVTSTDTAVVQAAVESPSWFDKLLEAAKVAGAYMTTRDLTKLNMERVKQGKEPISMDSIAPQVNVGMSPETRTLVIYGAVGLGALILLNTMKRR